jgi:hypothetical protein
MCISFCRWIYAVCSLKTDFGTWPQALPFGMWRDFKLRCYCSELAFVVLQSSHKMTYRATLLNILIFILLYRDRVFFLAGHQSPMIPWFGLEMGFGGSGGFAGEYCRVLLSKELFDRHIYILDCSLAANCYNTMPHINHISNVACGGAIREITVQVSNIDCTLTFYSAKCTDYFSQWLWLHCGLHVSLQLCMRNPYLMSSHPWIT